MTLHALAILNWLPALAAAMCGLLLLKPEWKRLAAPICITSIAAGFVIALGVLLGGHWHGERLETFDWITAGDLTVGWDYFADPLTMIMLLVVTGIGSLIAIYAAGYMEGDPGYARFFAYMSLFIFAMTTLVMADNLILIYLGWEGVGLCSYLLIGYYYKQPVAVAAAKKAFIVNRIGDLGFALGIFLTYQTYGTVSLAAVLDVAQAQAVAFYGGQWVPGWNDLLIPFLLMLGAFGKSAQLPLYVWLPDAMAGPTPVSALVHAATMVTAGVYLIARTVPLFELSPWALPTVATVGAVTALFAATIALCNNDLKGVFAYSTISQLGYMFLGVGALSTAGGVFHLATHAFFKALLFLTAGSVMHALAGQLDIRKMSGMGKKMPVTKWLMFAGCLALAGFPLTAGFWSKDLILADTLAAGLTTNAWYILLAILGIVTAFLTAFYTFRLWFTVFTGPLRYEMGEEHHGEEESQVEGHAADDPHHAPADAHGVSGHSNDHDHHHEPHEMPWLPMNAPLAVLAVLAILGGWPLFEHLIPHWVGDSTAGSAIAEVAHDRGHLATLPLGGGEYHPHGGHPYSIHHAYPLGMDGHLFMMLLSGTLAIAGIAAAWYFFSYDREAAARWGDKLRWPVRVLRNKYYVDELYDRIIVTPLRTLGMLFFALDQLILGNLLVERVFGGFPGLVGRGARTTQTGRLQGYGAGMALGLGLILLIVAYVTT